MCDSTTNQGTYENGLFPLKVLPTSSLDFVVVMGYFNPIFFVFFITFAVNSNPMT